MKTAILCLCVVSLLGCSSSSDSNQTETSANSTTTEPVEASAQDQTETVAQQTAPAEPPEESTPKVIVIDVRSKEEWDTGHVEQAVHIPHTEIVDRISDVTDDKDTKIVVYCKVGGRAGIAKTALEEIGFTNVENGGGFDDVKERFKPESGQPE